MSDARAEHDRRIDYVELAVTDVEAAKRFYGGVFRWEFTDYGPDYCEFRDGRLTGGFTTGREVVPGGPLVIMYATDLEGVEAAVREAGGRRAKATTRPLSGGPAPSTPPWPGTGDRAGSAGS